MEHVAGRAESLAKDKVKDPPPPFRQRKTESIYTKVYSSDGKEAREKRAQQHEIHQTAVEKLGEKEYRKLIQEVDFWTHTPIDMNRMMNKRVNEIQERMNALRKEEEASQRRTTRSQAGTSTETTDETEPVPQLRSLKRKNIDGKKPKTPDRKNTGGKKPKTPDRKNTGDKKPKMPDRKNTGGKKPKTPDRKNTGGKTPKPKEQPKTGEKKTPAPRGPQHVDDDEFELDINTGKFVRKEKVTVAEKDDELTSRKRKSDNTSKPSGTGDESRNRPKKPKKTDAVPLLEDDDDDDQDDLMIVDDEDHDANYDPGEDDDQDDDDQDYPVMDDDDDDFQIPPLRARKDTKKEQKQTKKKSTQRRVEVSEGDALSDETLSLFQRIVGDNFEVKASEEFETEGSEKRDRCCNPVEAAGFRATMKTLALEVKKAVRKGKKIKETYMDMISSTIKVATAMKYPGASTVEVEDITASITDMDCNAWQKHLKGKTQMEPTDRVMEKEFEDREDEDILIQQPMLGPEDIDAATEAINKLPKLLIADTNKKLRNLFSEMEKAHKHAGEASRLLRELHTDLPLNVFLRIADCAVRPLVILHIPKTESLIQKLKETAVNRQRRIMAGSASVVDVMLMRNLPRCGEWTEEDTYRPRKMIASLIHKYLRDEMLKEPTTTATIVEEFKLAKTMIHRQIWGKKYPGGGQKLEKVREPTAKASGSGLEKKKVAAVIIKRNAETEKLAEERTVEVAKDKDKKGKGKGKTSSGESRSAADIRKESTAEEQKQKRHERPVEPEEEDEDLPTQAEIAASGPASKKILIH